MTALPDGTSRVPELGISRLLLVVTGAVAAAHTPFWLEWLRGAHPEWRSGWCSPAAPGGS